MPQAGSGSQLPRSRKEVYTSLFDTSDCDTSSSETPTTKEKTLIVEPIIESESVVESTACETPSDIWNTVLVKLQDLYDEQIFNAYIAPLTFAGIETSEQLSTVTLEVPSRFMCEHVENKFGAKICELFKQQLTNQTKLVFKVVKRAPGAVKAPTSIKRPKAAIKKKVAPAHKAPLSKRHASKPNRDEIDGSDRKWLNSKYLFSNFVVGGNNQFCHAAAMQVAESPASQYNPLFIYGGVGLGKTHLLHAIANSVFERKPNAKILYMSAEGFMNELIQSLRTGKMDQFKTRLRNIEVLLIDDIQFISGKERTQEEFFHTFNALYNAKHQIVITCDKLPQEIHGLEERLQTRFAWGLIADLQAPDFETRVAILKKKASQDGVELPEDVSILIADNISSNVRELEGALTRLQAMSSIKNTPITLELAKEVLKPMLQPKIVNITVDKIKDIVASEFRLKISDLSSKRRTRNLSFPRHIAMYLCRKHTTSSYPEIGALFGGRDHSSVIHAANVVAKKMTDDAEVRNIVKRVEQRIIG